MGRGRTRSIRLALALALVTALAGVVAATAAALRFDDAKPCVDTQPLFVCPGGTVGTPYSIQFLGFGGCEPFHKYRIINGALPSGLSLSSSGLLSGTPTSAGTAKFWVELADISPADGGPEWCTVPKTAEREFSISIDPRVIVTTESAGPGTVGQQYTLPLVAQMMYGPGQLLAPSSPLTWSVEGQLPPGLALDPSTGVVSGTPTTEGSYPFTARAALVDGRFDTKGLTIVVRQPLAIQAPKPFAAPGAPTRWEVGVPFTAKLGATGGTGTYTWSLAEGSVLPPGLALAADGTVAGKPLAAGSVRSTIHLADDEGRTADYAATFSVASRLAVSTLQLRPAKVGKRYKAKLKTAGGILPKKWKIKGRLPRGIRFASALGVFTGTPRKAGRYRVTVEVTDALKVKSRKTFTLVVLA